MDAERGATLDVASSGVRVTSMACGSSHSLALLGGAPAFSNRLCSRPDCSRGALEAGRLNCSIMPHSI